MIGGVLGHLVGFIDGVVVRRIIIDIAEVPGGPASVCFTLVFVFHDGCWHRGYSRIRVFLAFMFFLRLVGSSIVGVSVDSSLFPLFCRRG